MDYNITDPSLELSDPNPDIWELFRQFDMQFFWGTLTKNCIELVWSPKMTNCAGLCAWNSKTGFCCIKLSLPLLQLRPRKDLVETLIHEMIHGFLFVMNREDNHEYHGHKFHYHMNRINHMTGAKVTVYHDFHDEVERYKVQYVWQCNGPCQHRHPFYGLVKRATDQEPSANDDWWSHHQRTCGGSFEKIFKPYVNNKPKVLRLPPADYVAVKRPPSPSQAGSSSVGIKRPTSSSQSQPGPSSNAVENETPEELDLSQEKVSDYWSKLGTGRRLCD